MMIGIGTPSSQSRIPRPMVLSSSYFYAFRNKVSSDGTAAEGPHFCEP